MPASLNEFVTCVVTTLLLPLRVFVSYRTQRLESSTARGTAHFLGPRPEPEIPQGTRTPSSADLSMETDDDSEESSQELSPEPSGDASQLGYHAGSEASDNDHRNPVAAMQSKDLVPRVWKGFFSFLERLGLVDDVLLLAEGLVKKIPSFQPCYTETECRDWIVTLRVRFIEPMLDLILPKLWASQRQSAHSNNSYQLHIETPPKNRRQQGDGDFVLLINGVVRSAVSFESKRDSVIDGYAEEHHDGPRFPNGEFRFADTAAVKLDANLPVTPHTSGILIKTALQSMTASKHHRIEVRFSLICGAYLGLVAERVDHPVESDGDFGVLFSDVFQSIRNTKFDHAYTRTSLPMILLALCLSGLYGIDDPGVDTVNKLFEEARFAEKVVPPETTAESGSDSSASYYPSSTNTDSSFKTGSSQGDTDPMDLA